MAVRRENVAEPALARTASYPPELKRLLDGEARISSIAVEVAQLHAELVRLRGESEAVERLLDDRQARLAENEAALARLTDECASAHERKAEAAAALIEAERKLDDSRSRVATLEDELAKSLDDGQAGLAAKEAALARLADECARAQQGSAEAATALAEAESELSDSRAQVAVLEHEAALLRTQVADLERLHADERAFAQEGTTEAVAALAVARTQVADLERLLDDERARAQERSAEGAAALTEAEKDLGDSRARVVALEDEVALLRTEIADLETRRLPPAPVPEPSPRSHVRIVPGPSGYTISESAGPPPNVGESVELDGRRFTVVRTGRSPLPLDSRPCVFLVAEVERVWER